MRTHMHAHTHAYIPVIGRSHTVVEPFAVMVEVQHTLITEATMLGSSTPVHSTHKQTNKQQCARAHTPTP